MFDFLSTGQKQQQQHNHKTSEKKLHCCETNKCDGSRYKNWSLNCRFCKKIIYVECLRERYETLTKELLCAFGLMIKTPQTDGSNKWEIVTNYLTHLPILNQVFNVDSPFAVTCEICANKFNNEEFYSDDDSETNSPSAHEKETIQNVSDKTVKSIRKDIVEVLNTNLIDLNATLSHIQNATVSNIQNQTKTITKLTHENDVFSLHLSRLPLETTSDEISAFIINNIKIASESFRVEQLTNNRYRGKARKF